MKRLLAGVFISFLASPALQAENLGEESKPVASREEGEKTKGRSPWSFQYMGMEGTGTIPDQGNDMFLSYMMMQSFSPYSSSSGNNLLPMILLMGGNEDLQTKNTAIRFYNEYLPGNVGVRFGMSSNQLEVQQENSLNDALLYMMLFTPMYTDPYSSSSTSSPFDSSLFMLLLLSNMQGSETVASGIVSTLDVAMTIHAAPDSVVDPYIDLGLGVGTCGFQCNAYKVFGKLGFRLNLDDRAYLFIEGEAAKQTLASKDSDAEIKISEENYLFGFGTRL